MGDKETFANELDRLLWPYVQWVDDNQVLKADPTSAIGDLNNPEYTHYAAMVGSASVHWFGDDPEHDNGFHIYIGDELVYHRKFGGPTLALRPGDWVVLFVEAVAALQLTESVGAVRDALDRHLSRVPAFTPI